MCRLPPPHAGIIAPPALSLIKPPWGPNPKGLDRQGLRCSAERMGPGHTVSRGRTPVSMQAAHTTFHHRMSPRVRREEIGRGWPGSPSASSCSPQASKAPKRGYKARGREFAVRTMEWEGQKGTGVWLPDPAPTDDLEKLAAAHLAVPHPEERKGVYRGGMAGAETRSTRWTSWWTSQRRMREIGGRCEARPSGPRPNGMGTRSSWRGAPHHSHVTWRHSMPDPVLLPLLLPVGRIPVAAKLLGRGWDIMRWLLVLARWNPSTPTRSVGRPTPPARYGKMCIPQERTHALLPPPNLPHPAKGLGC